MYMHDEELQILLTNDDGIDHPGIAALRDALLDLGEVTVVAPASNQSGVGRMMSREADVTDHPWGYSLEGTPSDCVVAGLEALVPETDIVVSGCNKGANLGMYVLGRSGTVSAAVEAAFFDVPAVAASLYVNQGDMDFAEAAQEQADYETAAEATAHVVETALDTGAFETADYLNINAPKPDAATGEMAITVPSMAHDLTARRDGHRVHLTDRMWERMAQGDIPDEDGSHTDRRAVADGCVSVSPLTAPHTTEETAALQAIVNRYEG